MSDPSTTDWISAASSVVQTVGALLAIGVTAFIARRSERDAARREQEAIARETAARIAADNRADAAIARAAEAENARKIAARARVAAIAAHSAQLVVAGFNQDVDRLNSSDPKDEFGNPSVAEINWVVADSSRVTLQALVERTDDPMLATLIEQALYTIRDFTSDTAWGVQEAKRRLVSATRELNHFIEGVEAA